VQQRGPGLDAARLSSVRLKVGSNLGHEAATSSRSGENFGFLDDLTKVLTISLTITKFFKVLKQSDLKLFFFFQLAGV